MTCDDAALLIDDHVDGACDPVTAAAVRHHLSTCAGCRALAADLSRIRAAARTLGPVAPPAHVWAGSRRRLQARPRPERLDRGDGREWRQLLAAAAGFALLASGLSWVGRIFRVRRPASRWRRWSPAAVPAGRGRVPDGDRRPGAHAAEADAPALAEPAFVALHASLVELDEAIGEARERLSAEPDDEFSQDSLLTALDNKVVLLQDTVALLDQDRDGHRRIESMSRRIAAVPRGRPAGRGRPARAQARGDGAQARRRARTASAGTGAVAPGRASAGCRTPRASAARCVRARKSPIGEPDGPDRPATAAWTCGTSRAAWR